MNLISSTLSGKLRFWRPLLTAVVILAANQLYALKNAVPKDLSEFHRIKAESWSITGRNLHLKGNIHIPAKNIDIRADEAVFNLDNQDIEVWGNVKVGNWEPVNGTITPAELAKLENDQRLIVKIDEITGDIWGEKNIKVSGMALTDTITCDKLSGNMKTGYFRFDNLTILFKSMGCQARSAERIADGTITAHDAKISVCEYLEDGNEHYSISANKMVFTPIRTGLEDFKSVNSNKNDYSVTMSNCFFNVYGLPLLWLPLIYKPKDESPGLFSLTWGKSSDWGYYISASKRFQFSEIPDSGVRILTDYFTDRGVGYGLRGWARTDESKTHLMAYSIYDIHPNEAEDYDDYRLRVPHDRYMFRLTHLTHVTPRLDFRAQFFWTSDYYFTKDFFSEIYNSDTQPSTFVAVEHQFDNFSFSAIFRPRVNRFYSTIEKLPGIRIDVPRQELFGTGLYYQGDSTADYMRNRWLHFNRKLKHPVKDSDLHDYEAFRFDTTHFLYLPVNFDWINFVPRAGLKFTAYSHSSKEKVSANDLLAMINAAHPQTLTGRTLKRYDRDGGAKTRLATELGFELSTKLHNTWNDLRVNCMGIDGLRHVMRPYVNYTFIDVAGLKRDHTYYFDDVDRIDDQNFFRFGLENRLQTRTGSGIRDIFSMENYWDLHLQTADGYGTVERFSRIGDLGTIVSVSPLKNLTLSSSFLISIDDQNGDIPDTIRNGRNVGQTGLRAKWLNRWDMSLSYTPIEDVILRVAYVYNRPYTTRSTYSMGTTFSQIEAGGYFDRYYDDHNELFTFGISMPLTPDRRTLGAFNCSYDFQDGSFSTFSFSLLRRFHCVEVIALVGIERDEEHWDTSFSMQARLLSLEIPLTQRTNFLLEMAGAKSVSTNGVN